MPTQRPRFTVILDEDLLDRIDDFRFENRYPSRTSAILDLLNIAIAEVNKNSENDNQALSSLTDKELANEVLRRAKGKKDPSSSV